MGVSENSQASREKGVQLQKEKNAAAVNVHGQVSLLLFHSVLTLVVHAASAQAGQQLQLLHTADYHHND